MSISQTYIRLQFTASVRRKVYQSFVDYLGQGIPISDIVHLLSTSIVKAGARSQMFQVAILKDIHMQMSSGVDFAEALARWVPTSEVMSIRAGMRSGDPVTGMKNTIDALDASSSMMSTIFGKLTYPAVLMLALFGLIFFFSTAIIPKMAEVMDTALWPDPAQKLNNMAIFVREDWYWVVAFVIVLSVGVGYSLPRLVGRVRGVLDYLPPYSFYKAFHGANLLISLAALMRSGIPFVAALEDMKRLSSPYICQHLDKMTQKMAEGASLGEALDTGLLSTDMMVSVYMMSHNANFQGAIYEIGRQAVIRSIEKISTIAGALNGLSLLGVTGYVGWVYYAFFTLTNALGQSVG
ncbi:type II secretion system F family protein (plasmid) [Pseudomonas silesiensis]|uniref:type II secretion system F family protein n=1 Tax=Pseudomonas silesiensis TaxID=1853130 RepID=UPI0030D2FE48